MRKNIKTIGDEIIINFSAPFDTELYDLFMQSKKLPEYPLTYDWETDTYELRCASRFAELFGVNEFSVKGDFLPFSDYLFDYQKYITKIALSSKRYAIWADTGLGKTAIMLELTRQIYSKTKGKILLIVPLNILPQTIDECEKFYGNELKLNHIKTRDKLKEWAKNGIPDIGITNPEKFIPKKGESEILSEIQHLSGCLLDEASLLKSGGGTIKWALIKSCRGIEYKYTFTATPAPNETMEYASQGSFLEKIRSEGEVIWKFFTRGKDGEWKVKDYAKSAFYRFMAGWSVYLREPKKYGFADNLKDLPKPDIQEILIEITPEQRELIMSVPDASGQLSMFAIDKSEKKLGVVERSKYSQLAKGFIYRNDKRIEYVKSLKPDFVVSEAIKNAENSQVLIWTIFDEENKILAEMLGKSEYSISSVYGKVPKAKRMDMIENFRKGKTDILITRADMLGFGMNFQNCRCQIFSGFNDSFEQFYQAVRRSYRYGQTGVVKIIIPIVAELEGVVWDNVKRKEQQFVYDISVQEQNYIEAMKGELKNYVN